MSTPSREGCLFLIGGHENKSGEILRAFVRRAGGEGARIALSTAATDSTYEYLFEYEGYFGLCGAVTRGLETLPIGADEAGNLAAVAWADAVFFTGGDQGTLVDRLIGSETLRAICRRHRDDGLVVGGTSAGASAMSRVMIRSGSSEEDPRAGVVDLAWGLGLLPDVVIDQHFTQRGRLGRLIAALKPPDRSARRLLGVGIAEDTAIVVTGREFEVIGSGAVTVLDATDADFEPDDVGDRVALAAFPLILHSLPSGYVFDLDRRRVVRVRGKPYSPGKAPPVPSPATGRSAGDNDRPPVRGREPAAPPAEAGVPNPEPPVEPPAREGPETPATEGDKVPAHGRGRRRRHA